eukprot:scaffold15510_cov213-Amphora_coffeaeformis.AAC.6
MLVVTAAMTAAVFTIGRASRDWNFSNDRRADCSPTSLVTTVVVVGVVIPHHLFWNASCVQHRVRVPVPVV